MSDGKGSVPLLNVSFDLNSATSPFLITGLRNATEYAVYTLVTEKDGQSSDIYFPAVAIFTTGPCALLSKNKSLKIIFHNTYKLCQIGSDDPKLVVGRDEEVSIVFKANKQNLCPLNATVKIEGRTVVMLRSGVFTFKSSMLPKKAVVVLTANEVVKELVLPISKTQSTPNGMEIM